MPDLGGEERARAKETGHLSVLGVVRRHRRVLATVGVAVVVISASRALRTALLPLWAEHVGMSASTTSLVFAVAAAVDVAFFLPGGWLMDTRGRTGGRGAGGRGRSRWPASCCRWPPRPGRSTAVMVLIAIGNGLGSGIVMTLGADTAPTAGRSQFLGAWRLCGDLGCQRRPAAGRGGRSPAPAGRGQPGARRADGRRHGVGRLLDLPGRRPAQPTWTMTSLDSRPVSESTTRNLFSPVWPVIT